ncbi:hypothetical protein FACS189441_4090 [Betaproteobacteria bacterium]|nr:hypothetical protein FACS189441_4090 [Betaproteobacteria bacterium]
MKTSNAVLQPSLKDNAQTSVKLPVETPRECPQELLDWFKSMDESCKRMAQDEAYREEITKRGF